MEILDPYQPQIAQRKLKYASFGLRLAALILDLMVTLVAFFLLMVFLAAILLVILGRQAKAQDRNFMIVVYFVLLPCFFILYFATMESSKRGGTLGKIGVGIKVGGGECERISFSTAVKRNLGKILSAAIVGIGFIMPIFNSKRQALHDKLARTFVYAR